MGRPTKFNEERAAAIAESLRQGSTRKDAAEAAGITYNCFLDWLARGEKARSGQFFEFLGAVTRAEGECAAAMAAVMDRAAGGYPVRKETTTVKTVFRTKKTTNPDGTVVEEPVALEERTTEVLEYEEFDWKAAESWLKRRRREEWSERQEVTGKDGGPIDITDARAELQRRLAGLADAAGAGTVPGEPDPGAGEGPAV